MPSKLLSYRLVSILMILILLVSSGAATASLDEPGQTQPPQEETSNEPVVVLLYYENHDQLTALAAKYDVWSVYQDEGYAVIALSPKEYKVLLALGYRMEIDPKRTDKFRNPQSIPGFPCYRTVEETYATLQSLNSSHPELVFLDDIGDSWDKVTAGGLPGYDLWAARITNESIPGPKPTFFLMAEIHARELATAELAIRFAEYLVNHYGTDPDVTFFLDYNEVHIVPMTNPDGRKFAETGEWWRKNCDSDDGCPLTDSYGVDLNRNYPFKWNCCGGSDSYPCGETYHGPSAGSEPETTAIMQYVVDLFPDQRGPGDTDPAPPDATGTFLTLHSAAALVLWPWGWTGTDAPNGAQLSTIGTKLATYNDYTPQQSNDLYTTDGTTDDWSYGTLGVASFTFEIAGEFFQSCSAFESTDWPDNLNAFLYMMKIPDTPYMTAYGPDVFDPLAIPTLVSPGDPVELTATINDQQNGSQTIQAAEYYLLPLHDPTAPGDPGTGTAMLPADGSWNSNIENVTGDIDTTSLATGTYVLAVRGRDSGSHWGPFSTTFLYVAEPGVAPILQGTVYDSCTNDGLPAAVEAGNFSTLTDDLGFYSMQVMPGTYDVTASADGFAPLTVQDVQLENYQTLELNFPLYPVTEVFTDDVESGNQGWTAGGSPNTWAITTLFSHSPTHSWTDSPSGNYQNYADNWVASPVLDFTNTSGVKINFWHRYDTESGYDYAILETSTNGGSTWTEAARWDGNQSAWINEDISLPQLDHQANARIRFRLTSDSNITGNGWFVDDIVLFGAPDTCPGPVAPMAGFNFQPDNIHPGTLVTFINGTTGTEPITYEWDFGDGIGTSTEANPTYTYSAIGTYTVVLTATNEVGIDVASNILVVEELVDVSGVTLNQVTPAPIELGQTVTFEAALTPVDVQLPVSYSVDFGDGTPVITSTTDATSFTFTHAYTMFGSHTVTIKAWNNTMLPGDAVIDTLELYIEPLKLFLPIVAK